MKLIFFTFSFYLLFLTLQPGISAVVGIDLEQVDACCADSCSSEDAKEESGSDSDIPDLADCNPFQSCQCCIVFKTNYTTQIDVPLPLYGNPEINNTERIPSLITLEFWQPPKILS